MIHPEDCFCKECTCDGLTICIKCEKVHGACSEVNHAIGAYKNMLPAAGESTGKGGGSARGNNRIPFLKAEHLTQQPQEAKILMVRNDPTNRFGNAVILKISLQGKPYFWTLKVNGNPNYQALLQRFGPEENDWMGQKIFVHNQFDEYWETYYPTVSFPSDGAKTTKRA